MTSVVGVEASDCACTLRGYLEYGADFDENNTATRQLREACETMLKNGVVLAELQGKSLRDSYLANPGTANFVGVKRIRPLDQSQFTLETGFKPFLPDPYTRPHILEFNPGRAGSETAGLADPGRIGRRFGVGPAAVWTGSDRRVDQPGRIGGMHH